MIKTGLASLFLGALLVLAFAPFNVFPFAVLAPAGLLWLWQGVSPKRAFWLGYLFGLGLFTVGVYWIYISIHLYGNVAPPLALFITAGMMAILACYPGLVGLLLNTFFPHNTTKKLICAFPALWVCSEWVRSWFLTGFPWLFLGYSQTDSPLKGYAPIFSVYGVTLFTVLTSALIVNAIIKYQARELRAVYFNLLAICLIWVNGSLLSHMTYTKADGAPIQVSLIQGNIPQSIKWSPEHVQLSLDRYAELTKPLLGKNHLIIWPEAAIPLPLQLAESYINHLDKKARETGSNLIIGIPMAAPDQQAYYNAIITLGKEHKVYLKRRLVPFGEYIPYDKYVGGLFNFMDIPYPKTYSGSRGQLPLKVNNIEIQPTICYEIAFPELVWFRNEKIGLILTVTNDAWFGESPAQAQHLQMAAMRAMELQRPVLFASNDGITAIIDANGNIASAAPPHEVAVLTGTVQARQGFTPWMYMGETPVTILALYLYLIAIREQRQLRKSKQAMSGDAILTSGTT
jgi:apolipoprotein N-acyltransferase